MEAAVNGSFAAKRSSGGARSTTLDADAARDLLNYFEIDENEKEFLISAITSSKAHEDEVKALLQDRTVSHPSEDDTEEDDDHEINGTPVGRHPIPWRTPENPEAPPMDENTARNLLYGFNIDDELREFLMAVIMSGKVLEDDLRQLYKIGLSAGWEAFQAQVQCAMSLRDKVLGRHYGDDLTVYLGMMRECGHITDFRERYWPLGAPALNAGEKIVAGKRLWAGLAEDNTTSLQSIQLVHDDDGQANNIIHPDKAPPDSTAINVKPIKPAGDTTKKTKSKAQSTEQTSSSAIDARFEVVCPIRRQDGSVCNKRCYDGKAYRSMQEHIRKVHKDHYIPGLNANEESFRLMVNNTSDASSNPQQRAVAEKNADEQAGDFTSQVVRPADLSLPSANGVAVDSVKKRRVTKKAKLSHEKSPAKSPFFMDQGQNPLDSSVPGLVPGIIPVHSALNDAFNERPFLPRFDGAQDGFGSMALGLDATISQSLFPQHADAVAPNPMSLYRKRKHGGISAETPQEQMSNQDMQQALNVSTAELYNPPVDPNLFFQSPPPPQPATAAAPDVFEEMLDVLGQLQEASREEPVRRDVGGPTGGHFNPPVDSTASPSLWPKRNPFAAPLPPAKAKSTPKQGASHFFVSPSKKIEEAGTAAVTPSPSPKKTIRPARGTVSALPIPPLSGDRFGLVQEDLADDPFRLLVAVTFLIRTPGRVAIPVFRQLIERYPTPQSLADADPAEIEAMMHHLGLSNQRTKTIQKYARTWLERPPCKEVRYGIKDYPQKGDGKDVRAGEMFGPEDSEPENGDSVDGNAANSDSSKENSPEARSKGKGHGTAWEIGHLTSGRYALDSWRIFSRDVLLGRAQDWKGKGRDGSFQPEWMRVLPEDKELRACLRWMWMKEGWEWDPKTGEKTPLRAEMRQAVDEGRVGYDNQGQLQIVNQAEGHKDGLGGA